MKVLSCAVLFNKEATHCLLGKRFDNERWALLGGHVEEGETSEECVRRELLEETGLVLERVEPVVFFDSTMPNGAAALVLVHTSVVPFEVPNNLEPEKTAELKWWSMWDLPQARPWCSQYVIRMAQEIVLNGR